MVLFDSAPNDNFAEIKNAQKVYTSLSFFRAQKAKKTIQSSY